MAVHLLSAQRAVLGAIIVDAQNNNGKSPLLAELPLDVDHFTDIQYRHLFAALRNLEAKGRPIEVAAVEGELEKSGHLDIVGISVVGLVALNAVVPTSAMLYAQDLIDAHARRSAIALAAVHLERLQDPEVVIVDEVATYVFSVNKILQKLSKGS